MLKYIADKENYIKNIVVDYAYHLSRSLEQFKTNEELGYRTAGSKAELECGDYLYHEMKKIGLSNVVKDKIILDAWTFEKANLYFYNENKEKIKSILGTYQINFDTKGIKTYTLVYAKKGRKYDYDGLDVTDKLVLIDIDQRNEWWVNYPAMQAKLNQAAAVICIQEKGFSEVSNEALNANDIIGPSDIPIFSITKKDGDLLKSLLKNHNNKISVELDAKSTVTFDAHTYNITGNIPGKTDEEYIIYSAHYDAYFDGFQDNATAVGIMFGIAKAMIDSGYQPDKTIVFTALAAEEWGKSDTRYDWSTGAYKQLFEVYPIWQKKGVLNINFELPAFLHNHFDEVTCVAELKNYLEKFIDEVPNTKGAYSEKTRVISPLTTWADDFSFALAGIPSVRNDFTSSKFRETHYHTNFDNYKTYNEKVFYQHHIFYGLLAINRDYLAVSPLDFSTTFNQLKNSLEKSVFQKLGIKLDTIFNLIHKGLELTNQINQVIQTINQQSFELKTGKTNEIFDDKKASLLNKNMLGVFRMIQDDLIKLNWEDEVLFGHEILAHNIENLVAAVNYLQEEKIKAALDNLMQVDNNFLAYHFDETVWNYYNDYVLKAPKEKLLWGYGKVVGHCNLYDIIEQLKTQDNTVAIKAVLEQKIKEQINLLIDILKDEEKTLQKIIDNLKLSLN